MVAVGLFVIAIAVGGSVTIAPSRVWGELWRGDVGLTPENVILWRIRLPRCVACLLVGAILGAVGSGFQAFFRNPLAEPYVVGVSSGAAVGGTAALILGLASWAGGLGTLALAFAGGLASLGLVLALARRRGVIEVHTLLLAGVVIGSMLSAALSVMLIAAGQDSGRILRWLLGSMTPMDWQKILVLLVVLAAGMPLMWSQARRLNVVAAGEASARYLGVDHAALRRLVLLAGTAMAAATVGAVGIIPFLGLIAPHIARRLVGADLRWSLPGSALVGAALLILADLMAQRVVPQAELPVGAVTALLGAPLLIGLLRRTT